MEPWQRIKEHRQRREHQQALEEGARLLQENPDDFKVRGQLEWIHYDLIKELAQEWQQHEDAGKPAPPELRTRLTDRIRDYARLHPQLPSMAFGNIVAKLSKIAKHIESFPTMLEWFSSQDATGTLGIPADQWEPNVWNEKPYPSNALQLARALAAWVKSNPDKRTPEILDFALDTAERVYRESEDADKLWLEWDLAALHRLAGDFKQAETRLKAVLKAKRSEFWPWAEAGRLYRPVQPKLAISCFCQALRLGKEPKFLGKIHVELAELLAEGGNPAQASQEAVVAAEIYDRESWSPPKELEALFSTDWYDPSLSHEPPESFYAGHAEQSLALCYDHSDTVSGNFLGFTEGRDGKKPLPRFAIRGSSGARSLLGNRSLKTEGLEPGDPVSLTIAMDGDREDILDVSEGTGTKWDQIEKEPAVISRIFDDGQHVEVYFDRERHFRVPLWVIPQRAEIQVGMGVMACTVHVGKKEHTQVVFAEPGPPPEIDDLRVVAGPLKKMDGGFGFVDNVFIPPHLLDGYPSKNPDASAVAVIKWNKKREEWGWQAIAISPANQSD